MMENLSKMTPNDIGLLFYLVGLMPDDDDLSHELHFNLVVEMDDRLRKQQRPDWKQWPDAYDAMCGFYADMAEEIRATGDYRASIPFNWEGDESIVLDAYCASGHVGRGWWFRDAGCLVRSAAIAPANYPELSACAKCGAIVHDRPYSAEVENGCR
jgi:hypothetical protein